MIEGLHKGCIGVLASADALGQEGPHLLGVLDRVVRGRARKPARGVMLRGDMRAMVRLDMRPLTGRWEMPTLYSARGAPASPPTWGAAGRVP